MQLLGISVDIDGHQIVGLGLKFENESEIFDFARQVELHFQDVATLGPISCELTRRFDGDQFSLAIPTEIGTVRYELTAVDESVRTSLEISSRTNRRYFIVPVSKSGSLQFARTVAVYLTEFSVDGTSVLFNAAGFWPSQPLFRDDVHD
jgi:hypothetical protein